MRRGVRHALLLLALLAAAWPRAAAADEYVYTPEDTLSAMQMHSDLAACIVRVEVGGGWYGGPPYDPNAIGQDGERGAVQLHPYGLLPLYEEWSGGASPYDPYTSMDFLDWAIEQGYGPQWSSWWWCA